MFIIDILRNNCIKTRILPKKSINNKYYIFNIFFFFVIYVNDNKLENIIIFSDHFNNS